MDLVVAVYGRYIVVLRVSCTSTASYLTTSSMLHLPILKLVSVSLHKGYAWNSNSTHIAPGRCPRPTMAHVVDRRHCGDSSAVCRPISELLPRSAVLDVDVKAQTVVSIVKVLAIRQDGSSTIAMT